MIKTRKGALLLIFFSPILSWIVSFLYALVGFADASLPWLLTDISKEILYLIFDYPHKHYTFKYFEV